MSAHTHWVAGELEIVASVEQARERMSHSFWSLGASVTSEGQR